jgi:hypothetical protein
VIVGLMSHLARIIMMSTDLFMLQDVKLITFTGSVRRRFRWKKPS